MTKAPGIITLLQIMSYQSHEKGFITFEEFEVMNKQLEIAKIEIKTKSE